MNGAFGAAHLVRQAAHALYVKAAGCHKERQHQRHDDGQHAVHPKKKQKGACKACQRGDECRDAFGDEGHGHGHVFLHAVQQVARVESPQLAPPAVQQVGEQALLHPVDGFGAEHGLYPFGGIAQAQLYDGDARQQTQPQGQPGAVARPRGGVDGQLGGSHEGQVGSHQQQAQRGVEQGLAPEPPPRPAIPPGGLPGSCHRFTAGGCVVSFHARLSSPHISLSRRVSKKRLCVIFTTPTR